MNSKTRVDSTQVPEKTAGVLVWVVTAIVLTISIPVALFLFEESQRERLLRAYALAAASINLPNQPGSWSTTLILQPNELIVCVMGSYGRVDDLPALNSNQRLSLSKSNLPSQDGSWYLLAFSERQVERIALYPHATSHLVFADDSCGDRTSQISISPRPLDIGGRELAISFLSR